MVWFFNHLKIYTFYNIFLSFISIGNKIDLGVAQQPNITFPGVARKIFFLNLFYEIFFLNK